MRLFHAATFAIFLVCATHTAADEFEDVIATADGEGYLAADSVALTTLAESFTRDRLEAFFSLSLAYEDSAAVQPRTLWTRAGLSARTGANFRADALAVRRSSDPRTLDELHLSLHGMHPGTNVTYTLGTYQLDWGLGLASSSAFGVARAFSRIGQASPGLGRGIQARPTSRESSWLFGAGLGREFGPTEVALFGSNRPWNARVDSSGATLSGPLNPATESGLAKRDQVNERLLGGTVAYRTSHVRAGTLAQLARYDPALLPVGSTVRSWSSYVALDYSRMAWIGEFVRSGNKSAGEAVLSGNADEFSGALYYLYAEPGFFAPRGQSSWSFGTPVENVRLLGLRTALVFGRHEFSSEVRATESLMATGTIAPSSQATEAVGDWRWQVASPAVLSFRVSRGQREDLSNGFVVDRATRTLRIRASWSDAVTWSLRFDARHERDVSGARAASGTYLHMQAHCAHGDFRPGLRVAFFDIPTAVAPFSIYEPTVRGAYPFSVVSGQGRRVSGWLDVDTGSVGLRAQFAAENDAAFGGTHYQFSLGLH